MVLSGLGVDITIASMPLPFTRHGVHLIDRMMEEYNKNRLENNIFDPTKELQDDIIYFEKEQEKERATRTDYNDY